ncbi:hypothetical protein FLX56_00850 [Synechococcus moorigangaii CMS01]|nr:hypothetical protein [Synechococcus moorigangaii CMS01]
MTKRIVGLSASSDNVIYVHAEVPDDNEQPVEILADGNWKIQSGDRSIAYQVLHQQCADYLRENGIDEVVIKASAVMARMSLKLGMLHTAEVRGVVIAAAAATCPVTQLTKSTVSRSYGDRNVDDYVGDDDFWAERTTGLKLRRMSRETTMLVIAARNG